MKIKRISLPVMTIEEFADKHGLTMILEEIAIGRYAAAFDLGSGNIDSYQNYGTGCSEQEALYEYTKAIAGKALKLCVGGERKEISVPAFLTTIALNEGLKSAKIPEAEFLTLPPKDAEY